MVQMRPPRHPCPARRYELLGEVSDQQRQTVAEKLLVNPVIEDIHFEAHTPPEVSTHQYDFQVVEVPIRDLDDDALMKLSTDGDMFLNITDRKIDSA